MTFPKARMVVSACLFLGWLSFLGYLVVRTPKTVLSRPQFLTASLVVVAQVQGDGRQPNPQITIEEVLWPADPANKNWAGRQLTLADLLMCQKMQGYQGAGKYLLPLARQENGEYLIAPLPFVRGYYPLETVELKDVGKNTDALPWLGTSTVGMLLSPAEQAPLLAASLLAHPRNTNRARIVGVLQEYGNQREEAETLVDQVMRTHEPVVVARRWRADKAVQLEHALSFAGASVGVTGDIRIYPLTAETRAQAEEILNSRR